MFCRFSFGVRYSLVLDLDILENMWEVVEFCLVVDFDDVGFDVVEFVFM